MYSQMTRTNNWRSTLDTNPVSILGFILVLTKCGPNTFYMMTLYDHIYDLINFYYSYHGQRWFRTLALPLSLINRD